MSKDYLGHYEKLFKLKQINEKEGNTMIERAI
jgi:hypothetical protein